MATQITHKELSKMVDEETLGNESLLTHTVIKHAMTGDFKPVQFIIEMILGRPKQQTELSSNPEAPVQITFMEQK